MVDVIVGSIATHKKEIEVFTYKEKGKDYEISVAQEKVK